MQGNINAIGIIVTVLITGGFLWKLGKKDFLSIVGLKKIIKGIVICLVVVFLNIIFSQHMCDCGNPFFQWLIPSICLFCTLVFIENKLITTTLSLILIVISFTLSQQFVSLVHQEDYRGNSNYIQKGVSKDEKVRVTYKFWHTSFTGLYGVKLEK